MCMKRIITFCLMVAINGYAQTSSRYALQDVGTYASDSQARVTVEIKDADVSSRPLPVRAIVTAADGSFADGSGHGLYADGRFYADGQFTVTVPGGKTRIELNSGPHYVPLTIPENLTAGRSYQATVSLYRWFSPEKRGWYCGDNHVHALHDSRATVKASLAYTALQGRANGLNWITEAGSNVPYDDIDRLDTGSFLLRYAQEQRPGAYVGHVNTPGIVLPILKDRMDDIMRRPLPVQSIKQEVHALGGVVAHTHPLTPRHQLHWMGATEFFSDAVLGQCADLFDIDSRATEYMWFMALNLGNRVAASGSTDSALGRVRTTSPGDRRVYCQSEDFTYPAIVEAMRQGRTVATNGGPFFPLFSIEGHQPGDIIELEGPQAMTAHMEIHTLEGVRTAQLYRNGIRVWATNLTGRKGIIKLEKAIEESETCWYVLRVEDQKGRWAITSPIYIESKQRQASAPEAEAILLEISNCTRFIELRKTFFAHLIGTVSPGETIEAVTLLKDGQALKTFLPGEGNRIENNRIPVTQMPGEYDTGWIWHPSCDQALHVQADFPVKDTGWYAARLRTDSGRVVTSDSIRFDASHANSRTISTAHLNGNGSSLSLWGYGEEMPLKAIKRPFVGDGWWYPKNTYWQLKTNFGEGIQQMGGGWKEAKSNFRPESR